ncbi:restriction endonuclease subunit S [Aeromonas veronii]|uniref:restriction endonuclease subunit S n=1 Tax=Aeromonas veronii TaxID=654 RepID=UPI002B47061B|nr:restriction endonuclease subunit S [Aeromonas veronii]
MQAYIPSTWAMSNIGAIADVVAGGTPKADDKSNFSAPGTGFAWLTPADLSGYMGKYISHGSRDLSEKGLATSSAKLMPAGALLFSSRAPIGYVAIAANEISTNQGFKNFVFSNEIVSTYAYYYLKSIRGLAESLGTGTTFKEISGATAKTLPFVIPPFAEQKEISDRLDILLAQVEATQARLARIPDIIKKFRQSVLAAAVSGKLTEEWRNGTESIDDPMPIVQTEKRIWVEKNPSHNEVNRVLKRVREYKGGGTITEIELPANWSWQQLEDSVLMIVDCHNKTAPYVESGIPLIRTSNIRDGKFVWQDLKFVNQETYEYWSRRCQPEPGDIIFTREAPMGEAAIVPTEQCVCLGQRTMLIRPLENLISAKYLLLAIMEPNFKRRSDIFAVGTGVKHYRVGDVSNLIIPIPPTEEQTEIVHRVEQLFAYADTIEQQAKAAKARVDNLSQAILAKAFRGELTADWRAANSDLIGGDNSAEALLAKINSERQAMKLANKKTRVKPNVNKNHQPQKNSDSAVINVINKKVMAKPQDIFNELKAHMDLREVLKEISQLLDQNLIREVDIDGQQHLEINR